MLAVDILRAVTFMCDATQMGVVTTSDEEMSDFFIQWFGEEYREINSMPLKANTNYLYSYDERLINGRGAIGADIVLENHLGEKIYIYEIE